jgi:HEAT repeat protein
MAKSPMVKTIGLVAVAVSAVAFWIMRPGRQPPPEPSFSEQAALGSQPGGETRPPRSRARLGADAGVGFHTREGSDTIARGSVPGHPMRMRARRGLTEEEFDRQDEAEKQADEARFTALQATALHAADAQERIKALQDLSDFDTDRTEPILLKAFSDSDPQVRITAIDELSWNLGSDTPYAPLAAAAADSNAEVRAEALQALDDLDDPRKEAIFKAALHDPDEDVRSWAEFYVAANEEGDDSDSEPDADADE